MERLVVVEGELPEICEPPQHAEVGDRVVGEAEDLEILQAAQRAGVGDRVGR